LKKKRELLSPREVAFPVVKYHHQERETVPFLMKPSKFTLYFMEKVNIIFFFPDMSTQEKRRRDSN